MNQAEKVQRGRWWICGSDAHMVVGGEMEMLAEDEHSNPETLLHIILTFPQEFDIVTRYRSICRVDEEKLRVESHLLHQSVLISSLPNGLYHTYLARF